MSSRLATVSMSEAARGLGWQGGGGWSPWVRRGAGSSLACAGRVARLIANKETQPMTAAADFVITSFDGRCVIVLPSRQLSLCGEPLSLVHYTGRPNSDWWAETLRELVSATLECGRRRCRHAIVHVESSIRMFLCLQRRRCCE